MQTMSGRLRCPFAVLDREWPQLPQGVFQTTYPPARLGYSLPPLLFLLRTKLSASRGPWAFRLTLTGASLLFVETRCFDFKYLYQYFGTHEVGWARIRRRNLSDSWTRTLRRSCSRRTPCEYCRDAQRHCLYDLWYLWKQYRSDNSATTYQVLPCSIVAPSRSSVDTSLFPSLDAYPTTA